MTREDIIRMAHEADCLDPEHYGSLWADKLERFAALVAAAEREECAKVCAEKAVGYASCPDEAWFYEDAAAAIRARGEKK